MTTFLYTSQEDQEVGSFFGQGPPEKIESSTSTRMMHININDSFTCRPVTMESKQDAFLLLQKPLHTLSGRQSPPRLLTPYSDDFFGDENDDNISTELTEPEATPWLFRPIAPPDDSADYDLTEHDAFQHEEDEDDDAWASFMSGIPMEIEILNEQRFYIEDDDEEHSNFDQILNALRAQSEELSELTGRPY